MRGFARWEIASKTTAATAVALIAAAAYLALSAVTGWGETAAAVAALGWSGLGLALALSLVNYGLRFVRWQWFLRTLGFAQRWPVSLRIYLAGFALTATPGKSGELLRSVLLARRGMPYGASAAAFLSERLSDLLAILLMVLPGLTMEPRGRVLVVAGVGAAAPLGLLIWRAPRLAAVVNASASRSRLAAGWAQVGAALAAARRCHAPALFAGGLILAVAAWAAEGLALAFVLDRLGAPVGLFYALFVYALALLAGALTFLPGGLGGTEAVMIALLVAAGVPEPQAVAATIIIRVTTLWFAVALGFAALAVAPRREAPGPAGPAMG